MIDRVKYMNVKEVKILRQAARDRSVLDQVAKRAGGSLAWLVVDAALCTGLRVSELAALKVENIDFERKLLKVMRVKKHKYFQESLAISNEFAKHLAEYLEGRTSGKLFVGKRGDLTAQGLQQIWKAAVKRADLPKSLSIHSARHTVAVHLLAKTNNLRQVQKQLGHASPVTTANLYADVDFETMQAGMEGLYGAEAVD